MGSQNCSRNPTDILKAAIDGGITAFQFREKGKGSLTGRAKLELGMKLREICKLHEIPFFINDDVELIKPLNVDGIHVGQDDVSVRELRWLYPDLTIGLSVSNEQEVENSPLSLVDYVGAGPVYQTDTKKDAKKPVGVEWIAKLRKQFPSLAIVGIGGINTENAHNVIQAGADGVSVISAIAEAKNILEAVRAL